MQDAPDAVQFGLAVALSAFTDLGKRFLDHLQAVLGPPGAAERLGQQGLRRRHGGERAGGADLAMPSSSRSMPGWISPSCK